MHGNVFHDTCASRSNLERELYAINCRPANFFGEMATAEGQAGCLRLSGTEQEPASFAWTQSLASGQR